MNSVSTVPQEQWKQFDFPQFPKNTLQIFSAIPQLVGTYIDLTTSISLRTRVQDIKKAVLQLEIEQKEGPSRDRCNHILGWVTGAISVAVVASLILGALYCIPLLIAAGALYVVMLLITGIMMGGTEGALYVGLIWPIITPFWLGFSSNTQEIQAKMNQEIVTKQQDALPQLQKLNEVLTQYGETIQRALTQQKDKQETLLKNNEDRQALVTSGAMTLVKTHIAHIESIQKGLHQLDQQLHLLFRPTEFTQNTLKTSI